MSEPTTSAAGGIAAWKLGAAVLGSGVVASGLGFIVLLPKTPREAAMRVLAALAGSALVGPVLVAVIYSRWPGMFEAGGHLMQAFGLPSVFGLLVVAAPILALAGLPFWWVLGALVLWFDKRRGKDLGELVGDARAEVGKAVAP